MSQLAVVVVEGVLGAQQHGRMSAARPIESGITMFSALVEYGMRVALITEQDQPSVERFLQGHRLKGQAFTRYVDDLEGAIYELQAQGNQVMLVLTPRKLQVDRVAQSIFHEWIPGEDPLIVAGVSHRRRPTWGEMMGEQAPEEDAPAED